MIICNWIFNIFSGFLNILLLSELLDQVIVTYELTMKKRSTCLNPWSLDPVFQIVEWDDSIISIYNTSPILLKPHNNLNA